MPRTLLSLLAITILLAGAHRLAAQPKDLSIALLNVFDYPARDFTIFDTGAINDGGEFVAGVLSGNTVLGVLGRDDGTIATPFAAPDDSTDFTYVSGINAAGLVCGSYTADNFNHGFFRKGNRIRTYDVPVPGAVATNLNDVNDAGDFCGEYEIPDQPLVGFARIGTAFISIPIAGNNVYVTSINNLGQMVGSYSSDGNHHGFFRDTDGTLMLGIDFPGANQTSPAAINDAGQIVGTWTDRKRTHAFALQLPDTFVSYDAAPHGATVFTGINNNGVIVGTSQSFRTRVLIAQLQGE